MRYEIRTGGGVTKIESPKKGRGRPPKNGTAAMTPAERQRAYRQRIKAKKAAPPLPKGLRHIDAALQMDCIICLEDGKKVQDLAAHLAEIGMTPDAYRTKWGLPAEYPMRPPSSIVREGATFEVDPDTGTMRHITDEVSDSP